MPVVNTAVILLICPAGGTINIPMDMNWYKEYFFNPATGMKGYWLKQTNNDMVLEGQVFDWVINPDPNPNLMNRTATAKFAVGAMENDHGVDFSNFDLIIVILGVNPTTPSDGGSTGVSSENRSHHAIVSRIGDPFDFMAHEIGHALGLTHSFGSVLFQTTGDVAGGYGHPYCIMSAMSYGGLAVPFSPNPLKDNRPEYSRLGPSLNAVSALGRGWLDAAVFTLPASGPQEFTIRSRHFGQKNPMQPPQAVEIRSANGDNYVVEFREPADWDRGQGGSILMIAQGRGALGEAAYPGKFSGTHRSLRQYPVQLGSPDQYWLGPDFAIVLVELSPAAHTARIRMHPRPFLLPSITRFEENVLAREVVERGETTWERGEKLCVEGTWRYVKYAQNTQWTFEARCDSVAPPVTATWTVEGQAITLPTQIVWVSKQVQVTNAKLNTSLQMELVKLVCTVESVPNGSRLRVRNDPTDETFHFSASVQLNASIGSAVEDFYGKFVGMVYDYGPEFEERREQCWKRFADVSSRYAKSKIVLPPDLWKRIPLREVERVQRYLDVLAFHHSGEDRELFEKALADLPELLGGLVEGLKIVDLNDHFPVGVPEGLPSPPAPAIETLEAKAAGLTEVFEGVRGEKAT